MVLAQAVDVRRFMETRGEYRAGADASTDAEQPERWVKGSLPLPAWATEPAWVMRYGRALPLVIYLLTRADWTTGVVKGYSHTACAEHYDCAKTTIAQQFRLLRECDKVSVTAQRQYDMDLVIARGPGIMVAPAPAPTPTPGYQFFDNLEPSGYQKIARRLSKNCYPLIDRNITSLSLDTDAYASGTAALATDAPPAVSATTPTPASKTRRARKLTDAQLEAHRAEQGYVAALLAAVKELIHAKALPTEGRERQAAHWFYKAHDGEPAPVADVMACYRITKRTPFWRGKYLSLQHLEGCYLSYRAAPDAYERDNPANGRRGAPKPAEDDRRIPRDLSVPPVNAKPAQLD